MIRSSTHHWQDLARLLAAFDRCVEACARLDAWRLTDRKSYNGAPRQHLLDLRLRRLEHRIGREVDRVTAERLRVELAAKIKRAMSAA